MKSALFRALKISEFGKWVERHNGDDVIHVASADVTGARERQHGDVHRDEKSVNTNFIQKSFLLYIVNRHKRVIAQI